MAIRAFRSGRQQIKGHEVIIYLYFVAFGSVFYGISSAFGIKVFCSHKNTTLHVLTKRFSQDSVMMQPCYNLTLWETVPLRSSTLLYKVLF